MADRYQPYEDDWRGGRFRERDDDYRYYDREREEWRGRGWDEDARGRERGPRERGGWRPSEGWRGSSEPEWRGSREFRAGDRSWRGEGEPYGHQRGEPSGRGTWDRGRYPDENYGGPRRMRDDWSDERRSDWEREPWGGDWRTMSRDPGRERGRDWGERGYGERQHGPEGPGWASAYGWTGGGRSRGLYGTETGRGYGEYSPQRGQWPGEESRYGTFTGRGPKGYQRSDDRIREDISDRLTDDPMVDASEITIEVKGGEVTLSGTVEDRDQKRRAEDIAEQVPGVRDVSNHLRVHKGFLSQIFGSSEERDQPRQGEARRQGQEQPQTQQQQRPKVTP
jgi:hypothetical protein